MVKFTVFIFIIIISNLFSKNITIKANLMENKKNSIILDGNVFIKIDKTTIKGNKAIIILKKYKILNYKLIGNINFNIFEKENLKYRGKSNSLKYISKGNIYYLSGDVEINNLIDKRTIKGDEIKIDIKLNKIKIQGKKDKPVSINFNI